MADPVVHITNGVPDGGTGNITTLGAVVTALGTPMQATGGSVTANAGTNLDTSSLALETGGNLAATAAVAGTTAGAAVITDVNGTLQQYLRGLVKLLAAGISVAITNANANGRAVPASSAPVVLNSQTYKACPASATTLLGATGATGDYLDGVLIIPGTAAAGIVQIQDASGTAITVFAGGGTTALPTLAPFYVPIGAVSSGGAGGWKVITNANVTAVGVGNFT